MPCYHPLTAWRAIEPNASGAFGMVFKKDHGRSDQEYKLSCGQCIGCRLERSRQWAVRCVHEAQLHDANCFITLTYDDNNLPAGGGLDRRHLQLFVKRLRKRLSPLKIRFFGCGEYGDESRRPHYHLCLFGTDFGADRLLFRNTQDYDLYISPTLSRSWVYGFSVIGDLTFDSAAYTARYSLKKLNGAAAHQLDDDGLKHYQSVCGYTGEIHDLLPEFLAVSNRPGIGAGWYELYADDVYPSDEVIVRGQQAKPPRYYDKLLERTNSDLFEIIKSDRKDMAENSSDNDYLRLIARETVKISQIETFLSRNI